MAENGIELYVYGLITEEAGKEVQGTSDETSAIDLLKLDWTRGPPIQEI